MFGRIVSVVSQYPGVCFLPLLKLFNFIMHAVFGVCLDH